MTYIIVAINISNGYTELLEKQAIYIYLAVADRWEGEGQSNDNHIGKDSISGNIVNTIPDRQKNPNINYYTKTEYLQHGTNYEIPHIKCILQVAQAVTQVVTKRGGKKTQLTWYTRKDVIITGVRGVVRWGR